MPVVHADDRVIGVVSEFSTCWPRRRRKWRSLTPVRFAGSGSTACTRRAAGRPRPPTTSPAITVAPGTTVADAAWLAARSRLKRLPVVDHKDRLVGVVSRIDLVRALVRDDTKIREEIETRIIPADFLFSIPTPSR